MSNRKRHWNITKHNHTDDTLKILNNLDESAIEYAIFTMEVGEKTEREHIQGYISFHNAKSMSAVKKFLGMGDDIHLEPRRGTHYEAASYCWKEQEPFKEIGIRPTDTKPLNQWEVIKQMLSEGRSEYEIAWEFPATYGRYHTAIAKLALLERQQLLNQWRDVKVEYIYGDAGSGKTRSVLEKYGKDVYRVSNYSNPWDGYMGQPVILFEEFRSSMPIEQMLIYLDGYICTLPCRYADKVGDYTKIYFATNIHILEQYPNIQLEHPETYRAFLRRIDRIIEM